MSWKYINPGYGALFLDNAITNKSYVFNPQHGVSIQFYGNHHIYASEDSPNLYFKFDVFFEENVTKSFILDVYAKRVIAIYVPNANTGLVLRIFHSDESNSDCWIEGDDTNLKDGLNTFWVHLDSSGSRWRLTVVINGQTVADGVSASGSGYSSKVELGSAITFKSPDAYVSNIIISNEEIHKNETIVKVESSAIESDMAVSDTSESDTAYLAVSAGNICLQVLDASNLSGTFGADGKVLGMVAIAAPAYTTGEDSEDIMYLKCRTVVDGKTTDKPTLSPQSRGCLGRRYDMVLGKKLRRRKLLASSSYANSNQFGYDVFQS